MGGGVPLLKIATEKLPFKFFSIRWKKVKAQTVYLDNMDLSVSFRNISNFSSGELYLLSSYTDLIIDIFVSYKGASYYDDGFYLDKDDNNKEDPYSIQKMRNIVTTVKSFRNGRISVSASYNDSMANNLFKNIGYEGVAKKVQDTIFKYGIDGFGFDISTLGK
ncbi:hypothetical protein BB560_006898, partial [Smittium megazygosporum]